MDTRTHSALPATVNQTNFHESADSHFSTTTNTRRSRRQRWRRGFKFTRLISRSLQHFLDRMSCFSPFSLPGAKIGTISVDNLVNRKTNTSLLEERNPKRKHVTKIYDGYWQNANAQLWWNTIQIKTIVATNRSSWLILDLRARQGRTSVFRKASLFLLRLDPLLNVPIDRFLLPSLVQRCSTGLG